MTRTTRFCRTGAVLVCLVLAIVHTWPLATAPATLSRNDNGDAQLNEWILAWIAHQLPRDPLHLFQANIFYPARDTLAYSEPLIVPAVMGAPLAWLGASPVLVYNLLVIAGFALTTLAGAAVIYAWTRDRAAALLAGSMFAFNTHTLTRLAHVQGLHIYGLPLALLAADRIITGSSRRAWLLLTAAMALMAYTSGYLVVFAIVMLAVALLARLPEWWPRAIPTARDFGLAAAASALVIIPVYLPYARVAREQQMVRPLEQVAGFSATLGGYLASAGRIHMATWSSHFFENEVDSFFPGVIVVAFAAMALWLTFRAPAERRALASDMALTRRRVLMLVAIAAVGLVLSLGTATPLYGWLYAVFPPMRGLRAAARFGNLFLLGMSMLAGVGFARVRRAQPRTARTFAIAVLVLVAANAESLRAPFEYRRYQGIPRVYDLLAAEQGEVVLAEVPFYPRQAVFENSEYVLNSTRHWRSLMNGYSGYTPESYLRYAEDFWHFPDERAIRAMHAAGVTHVMVHPSRFGNEAGAVVAKVQARSDFELLAVGPRGRRLYRLR